MSILCSTFILFVDFSAARFTHFLSISFYLIKSQKWNPYYWHSFDSIPFLVSLMNEWFCFSFPVFPCYFLFLSTSFFLPESSFFFLSKSILFVRYCNTKDIEKKGMRFERVNKFLITLGMRMNIESESRGMKERGWWKVSIFSCLQNSLLSKITIQSISFLRWHLFSSTVSKCEFESSLK